MRTIIQAVSLLLFTTLFVLATYKLPNWLPADIYLRLDPLLGMNAVFAAREIIGRALWSLVTIGATLTIGRFFCAYVCPMGASIDFLEQLALGLPASAWKDITWRPGSQEALRSRFAAVRVRPAHRDEKRTVPRPEEWLLIEWPKKESEPTKYWLSTLPEKTARKSLVKIAKHRWIIERDYEELKQELGLGHYEGRSWRGFHHHATLCIAAYGFLISERNRFSPSARAGHVGLSAPELSPDFRPRGSPRPPRTTLSALDHHDPHRDRAPTAAATTSLSFLRIAARIIVGIYLDVPYATLRSVGFGAPGTIQPFHARDLYPRQAAPDPLIAARQWSVLGFSTVLITEHSPIARLVVAHHMRTQEPGRAVIPRCDWPVLHRRRNHKAVNFLGRLTGSRTRSAHLRSG